MDNNVTPPINPNDQNILDTLESVRSELVQDNPSPMPIASPPKRRSRTWLYVVVGLVLIAGTAAAAYSLTRPEKKPAPPSKGISQSTGKKQTQAAATTDISALLLAAKNATTSSTPNSENLAPDYMVEGYNYYAAARKDDTKGLEVKQPEAAIQQTAKDLEAFLLAKGFAKSTQQVKNAYYPLTKYENADTLCGINYFLDLADTLKTLYITCALKSSYLATAQLQQPFYDTYRAANKGSQYLTDDSRLGYPTVKDSRTSGYKVAEAAIYSEASPGGAMGLFYQTPDGTWNFFKGTQQSLMCKDFSSPDLKKAYAGDQCFSENGSASTVKV
ncbi:hypothetical protein IPL68_07315 [Candidatus Saccharibacteria bacterium]|nr:MAG: hypothetical protein IPL68_07315 [Candidatus Saccharibacteria bacterium]